MNLNSTLQATFYSNFSQNSHCDTGSQSFHVCSLSIHATLIFTNVQLLKYLLVQNEQPIQCYITFASLFIGIIKHFITKVTHTVQCKKVNKVHVRLCDIFSCGFRENITQCMRSLYRLIRVFSYIVDVVQFMRLNVNW